MGRIMTSSTDEYEPSFDEAMNELAAGLEKEHMSADYVAHTENPISPVPYRRSSRRTPNARSIAETPRSDFTDVSFSDLAYEDPGFNDDIVEDSEEEDICTWSVRRLGAKEGYLKRDVDRIKGELEVTRGKYRSCSRILDMCPELMDISLKQAIRKIMDPDGDWLVGYETELLQMLGFCVDYLRQKPDLYRARRKLARIKEVKDERNKEKLNQKKKELHSEETGNRR